MENISNKSASKAHRCIISTGSSSERHLKQYAASHAEESTLIYNCGEKDEICNIIPANHYDIIISYSDESVNEIIYDLFNSLIPQDVPIRVVFIMDNNPKEKNLPKHVAFLEKLEKHKFITLEFIDDTPVEPVKQEDNIIYFVGPGNTGKTSIIASLSESFRQNGQKLALIDITRSNKLINYFPKHTFLNTGNLKDFTVSRDFFRSVNIYTDGLVDLYVYDYDYDKKGPEVIYFCEIQRKLSELYDYIIVNADESSLMNTPYIFKTASKIFIVHDFIPTKIRSTKRQLLKMISAGIDTQETVSLIYNKTLSDTVNIGRLEEKMLFIKLPSKKIIPAVDINCKTFEIPYEQKTMAAIIRNLTENKTGIENTSKRYRTNITNIYKHINNILYTDKDEMEISQYIREKLQKLTDRKQLSDWLKSLKTSSVAIRSVELLQNSKARIKSAKLPVVKAEILKQSFAKVCRTVSDTVSKNKYYVEYIKKQHS